MNTSELGGFMIIKMLPAPFCVLKQCRGARMIRFENVTKIFKDTGDTALSNVSFKISKGDFVFLIGSTGAGKTTIARLILRDEAADSGRICVYDTDIAQLNRREVPHYRRKIGMVFQDYKLLPSKTVYENIAFAMEAQGVEPRSIAHMIPQILSLVGLENKSNSMPYQLSGGEQQRAALARAMANNPPILIADEPTGNLDPDTTNEIMKIFEKFNRLGTTIIISTHDSEMVDRMKKRVIELNNGTVIRDERGGGYRSV